MDIKTIELSEELIKQLDKELQQVSGQAGAKFLRMKNNIEAFLRLSNVKRENKFKQTGNPLAHLVPKVEGDVAIKRISLQEAAAKNKAIKEGKEKPEIEYVQEAQEDEEESEGNVLATSEDKKRSTRKK